jgi:serine/threonine protein kinase
LSVKIENILMASKVSGDLTVKVSDSILVQIFENESGMRKVFDNPIYLAPETITSDTAGSSADIWALGVILHMLITGGPPFTG